MARAKKKPGAAPTVRQCYVCQTLDPTVGTTREIHPAFAVLICDQCGNRGPLDILKIRDPAEKKRATFVAFGRTLTAFIVSKYIIPTGRRRG